MKKYVSWRRVSTFKQNKTGLGLSAQKEIIRYFIERDKGEWLADFEECYTGTELSGCSELKKAMALAKKEDAILIIAKTDRFRNTAEALKIYEEMGDGHIMFCDLPTSDKFSLTLFFALAEREALLVSIRTKQALAAKKARGERTGGASKKWRESFNAKSDIDKLNSNKERGKSRSHNYLERKDTQAFFKVLRNVFPAETALENPKLWLWNKINTKGTAKEKMLSLMHDYHDFDGTLFEGWDFSEKDNVKMQVKLSGLIGTIKRSVMNYYN